MYFGCAEPLTVGVCADVSNDDDDEKENNKFDISGKHEDTLFDIESKNMEEDEVDNEDEKEDFEVIENSSNFQES